MEETNYDRINTLSTCDENEVDRTVTPLAPASEMDKKVSGEKSAIVNEPAIVETGRVIYSRKTYLQKLSLCGDKPRPNRILDIIWSPFKFFRFPVVVWAGFMYGTNALVWPGILNATASPIYTGVYGFKSNAVGFTYFGAVFGMILGFVFLFFALTEYQTHENQKTRINTQQIHLGGLRWPTPRHPPRPPQ